MAKKKSASKKTAKKQSNILFTIIGMVLAALVLSTLAFNVFHTCTMATDVHSYVSGVQYIGNLFAGEGEGYTAFVDVAGVICYMLTLLGSLGYIVLAILKIVGIKLNANIIKLVACFTALIGLVFAIMTFISAGNATQITVIGDREIGVRTVASLAVYVAAISSIANAVVSVLDK